MLLLGRLSGGCLPLRANPVQGIAWRLRTTSTPSGSSERVARKASDTARSGAARSNVAVAGSNMPSSSARPSLSDTGSCNP